MSATNPRFIDLALSGRVAIPALKVSIIVGTVLAIINHGVAMTSGELDVGRLVQIGLTYLVPYCVSTYSSVRAIQGQVRDNQAG